jgi:aspartyl-tRNA synthetase
VDSGHADGLGVSPAGPRRSLFIDLRDREGLTQCVFNPGAGGGTHAKAEAVRTEFVLAVRGTVSARPPGTENPKLATGGVEVQVSEVRILNESRPLPFQLDDDAEIDETLRLKYRYLDMRRPHVLRAFQIRDQICRAARDYLHGEAFLEVETPFLTRSTPEGARDFLVPSRLQPGSFYALPQSPQLFKQLLMVAGFERYFQIVRCFRDEDLRKDRQPEFTQIDIETSFLDRDDFLPIIEGLVAEMWRRVRAWRSSGRSRIPYDRRWPATDRTSPISASAPAPGLLGLFAGGGFQLSPRRWPPAAGEDSACGAGGMSQELDDLTAEAKQAGAKAGLDQGEPGRAPVPGGQVHPGIQARLVGRWAAPRRPPAAGGDTPAVGPGAGAPAREHARRFNPICDRDVFAWIIDFPLVEWNVDEKRWDAVHHPFTAPRDEDIPLLETDPGRARAKAYDLVLNGQEAAGGSIRIHQPAVQERVFGLIGISKEDARARFGFLLDALEFGAPPMGGIAFGLDRLAANMAGQESIREVIAFPKTQKGTCPLTDAPAPVDPRQLRELGSASWKARIP